MPRSAPFAPGALWPAERIANAIISAGIPGIIEPVLTRTIAVPKSSRAARGERPNVTTHFGSFAVTQRIGVTDTIVIVDDVITKGTTALAAASRLAEVYPFADIKLFTFLRTKGLVPDIESIADPTVGHIQLFNDEGNREP